MKVFRKLWLGDCLERMKEISDDSIDLVITSPPYDNLRNYNNSLDWNFGIFKKIAKELKRVIKRGGVVVWVVGDATVKGSETGTSFRQVLYFKKIGLNIHDTMIYKKDSCSFPEINRYYPYFEYMFVFSKGKPKTSNLIRDKINRRYGEKVTGTGRGKDGVLKQHNAVTNKKNRKIRKFGVRGNVWEYSVGKWKITKDEIAYQHPAIFPEQLAYDHILSWSNPGDIVLDPMMGSCTVGKQCMLLKRNFIGIEKDKEYFKIAKQRIRNWKDKNLGV